MIYALDSNIISYILKGDDTVVIPTDVQNGKSEIIILPIVQYEVKKWLILRNYKRRLKKFTDICLLSNQVVFTQEIFDYATDIYVKLARQGKIIDDHDIFIAAFCIVNGYTLVTNNTRHFERIDGLRIDNWKVG